MAYMAAGTKRGLAQSIYQVGGNSGQAMAPLITALILVPLGQFGAVWFTLVAALAVLFLTCDEVIDAMYKIGQTMPTAHRETGQGGLAATPTGRELEKKIFGGALGSRETTSAN